MQAIFSSGSRCSLFHMVGVTLYYLFQLTWCPSVSTVGGPTWLVSVLVSPSSYTDLTHTHSLITRFTQAWWVHPPVHPHVCTGNFHTNTWRKTPKTTHIATPCTCIQKQYQSITRGWHVRFATAACFWDAVASYIPPCGHTCYCSCSDIVIGLDGWV